MYSKMIIQMKLDPLRYPLYSLKDKTTALMPEEEQKQNSTNVGKIEK